MSNKARYIVGIDLGTTNSALGFVDTKQPHARIESLPIEQLVAFGNVEQRPALPSFLYIGGEHDVRPGDLDLPWASERSFAVGELAREQGARVSGRTVTSAKSWLCHGGVDREAAILPWSAPEDVEKISPIDASARYLEHLKDAWNRRFPKAPLQDQEVILTVPASFDEVGRELTVRAADQAGLQHATLLEEPQAAFYAWIEANPSSWEDQLAERRLALVVDVGGGTSDFSLIRIDPEGEHVALDRLAVGDHILLGGDNIDVALARVVEERLGEKLDSQRWHSLTNLCRAAKEELLGDDPPPSVPIRLGGRGRSVIGGSLNATIARDEVMQLVLDGFFPIVEQDAKPRRDGRAGLQEWGLPFATEAELSRHLAAFLDQHRDDPVPDTDTVLGAPDVVLFNGGALKPQIIRQRLTEQLSHWSHDSEPLVLESSSLDLAVSRGAAYYGLVRRGTGVRIGGGSPRSFYLGLLSRQSGGDGVEALCVVRRGMHEGDEIEITEHELEVTANRPVSFPLYSSSTRLGDESGSITTVEREELAELPPIRTVLRFGRKLTEATLPVHVVTKLTEIGTLELSLRSLRTDHRWRLQFKLREQGTEEAADDSSSDSGELAISAEQLAAASEALREIFPAEGTGGGEPVTLTRRLEEALGAGKDAWPIESIRALWDLLLEARAARKASQAHEARWLNMAGFLLRPGFGHETDEWRIQQLWRLYSEGMTFARATQCRVEWWNLWKRIAGGLSRPQQTELYQQVAPFLLPRLKNKRKDKSAVGPQEIREYWQLVASCERLGAQQKTELDGELTQRHDRRVGAEHGRIVEDGARRRRQTVEAGGDEDPQRSGKRLVVLTLG